MLSAEFSNRFRLRPGLFHLLFISQQGIVCLPWTLPPCLPMFSPPFSVSCDRLSVVSLLSCDAKSQIPICDRRKDRGSLLYFKGTWVAFTTLALQQRGQDTETGKLPAKGVLCVCVCVCVCMAGTSRFPFSCCHYWHEKSNMRWALDCGVWACAWNVGFPGPTWTLSQESFKCNGQGSYFDVANKTDSVMRRFISFQSASPLFIRATWVIL